MLFRFLYVRCLVRSFGAVFDAVREARAANAKVETVVVTV